MIKIKKCHHQFIFNIHAVHTLLLIVVVKHVHGVSWKTYFIIHRSNQSGATDLIWYDLFIWKTNSSEQHKMFWHVFAEKWSAGIQKCERVDELEDQREEVAERTGIIYHCTVYSESIDRRGKAGSARTYVPYKGIFLVRNYSLLCIWRCDMNQRGRDTVNMVKELTL